jgi:uncharacterized protein (DUF302 family)
LATEGFGILTEIDVQATMLKKLGKEMRPYVILGACNPPQAYKALTTEPDIGLMLPCNVIVYDNDERKTVVAAIDPSVAMEPVGNADLSLVAHDIRTRLERAVQAVASALSST